MRIGILLTHPKSEKKKDELVNIHSRIRPWLKLIADISNKKGLTIRREGKTMVGGDVSIGLYIMWNYPNVEIDFIRPHQITSQRLKSNDLNFSVIYDLLESYHNDSKRIFNRYKRVLERATNVYPSYQYQKFINNKCNYYKYLEKKKVTVVPTFCISSSTAHRKGLDTLITRLLNKIKHQKWKSFIAKPVYGQESLYFKKFNLNQKRSFRMYMKKALKKFPGIIFQEYVKNFDKENPEVRAYFVGERYEFSIVTTKKTVKLPKQEGGTAKIPKFTAIKKQARSVLRKLPPMVIRGKRLPRLLSRIDIGCCLEGKNKTFVNELEFVPSLYIEDHKVPIDAYLGDQMIKITKKFLR